CLRSTDDVLIRDGNFLLGEELPGNENPDEKLLFSLLLINELWSGTSGTPNLSFSAFLITERTSFTILRSSSNFTSSLAGWTLTSTSAGSASINKAKNG